MRNEKRHITISLTAPSEELYRFGADGNLRLYSYDRLFFAVYGYDGGTTRTYKYSFDLNPNWVNGRLESVNFNLHTAMFYPNNYLNFNSNGYYTKHYYNGMERIASRLGDNNLSLATHDPELQDRKDWQDSLIRRNVTEITGYEFLPLGQEQDPDDPKPVFELPQVGMTGLQPIGGGDVFYYHPNHLGSTCYVTDGNASVQQGFLYAPFGEITNEYNAGWQSGTLPKYSFNAKELDEETGMYYYEARYMAPPVFISRDPLFEKYPTFSPYAYCANNPVKYIDPDGCASLLPDPIKKSISKAITTSAEYAHALYNRAASIVQSHPQWISKINRSLSSIKKSVEKVTDMNPMTMGWLDLTNIWLFELGNKSEYMFGPEANTTMQLMNQTGVKEAREIAHNNIKNGKFDIINHPWRYDTEQFYEGMSEGNAVTSFLGSYTTTVNISHGKKEGEFILNFEVKNTSSWESATRLRKDNDGNGNHDGIIPSKERGVGIRLGGNVRQTWKWTETFSVN